MQKHNLGGLSEPKKNPGSKKIDPGLPFFISDAKMRFDAVHVAVTQYVQAGLLTFGSSYRLRLPGLSASGIMQLSSPNTAAGPSPIFTRFPILLFDKST